MKNFLLIILLFTSFQAFCKKKPDPKDLKIDSLTKVTVTLTSQLDSVTTDRNLYYGLYTTIKEKVVKQDFDPTRMSDIIDSLKASRDSSFIARTNATATKDSADYRNSESYKMKTELETAENKMNVYAELKQLKELLDIKILTFTEFEDMKKKLLDKLDR